MLSRALAGLLLMALTTGSAVCAEPAAAVLGPPFVTSLSSLVAAPAVLGPPIEAGTPAQRFWVDAEALLWWMKGANLPPLVTSSPPGTLGTNVGVLGVPGTTVLFGGSPVNGGLAPGGRVTTGFWLDCEQNFGIQGYFFQLAGLTERFNAGSPTNLGRPFFNTATGRPDAELISFPGLLDGTVRASAASGSLIGAGVLGRPNLCRGCCYRLDALVGYRYLSMTDRVNVTENLTSTDQTQTVAPLGTNILLGDRFHTFNQFNGGDIGLTGEVRWKSWILRGVGRVALGSTFQLAEINGATIVTVPGFPPVANAGGLLALSSNSGRHTRNVFAVVPEVGVQLGYQISSHLSVHAGYDFLYWSNVLRAGDQIDLTVNPGLLPPPVPGASPQRPAFTFHDTGFWAQGINVGLEFRF